MSTRPWHRPYPAEVLPRSYTWREHIVLALGLVGAIIAIRLWRLLPK